MYPVGSGRCSIESFAARAIHPLRPFSFSIDINHRTRHRPITFERTLWRGTSITITNIVVV
jgi:hypothetical protein